MASTVHAGSRNQCSYCCRIHTLAGMELLELLYKNPKGILPLVLRRLKKKEVEWRRVQEGMGDTWKKQLGQNLIRAADYRSLYSHQREQKSILPHHLVQNLVDSTSCQIPAGNRASAESHTPQPEIHLQMGQYAIHHTLFHLIYDAVEQSSMLRYDKNRVLIFWNQFFARFIDLSTHAVAFKFVQGRTQSRIMTSLTRATIEVTDQSGLKSPRGCCAPDPFLLGGLSYRASVIQRQLHRYLVQSCFLCRPAELCAVGEAINSAIVNH